MRDSGRSLVELPQALLNELQIKQAPHPALRMTACCMLVFIVQSQSVSSFSNPIFYLNQSALTLQQSLNLFFFCGRANPKPPLKAVTGLAFVSSLASFGLRVARGTCQCANR